MAFNTCPSQGCPPSTHTIHLAYSDDGLRWLLVEDFGLDHAGSVPDIVFFDGFLYLFHTRSGGNHSWDRLNSCFEILEQGDVLVTGGDAGDEGWVDPSLIVNRNNLVLFYLPGVPGGDPASCSEDEDNCIKSIRSAKTDNVLFPDFTKVPGSRVDALIGNSKALLR